MKGLFDKSIELRLSYSAFRLFQKCPFAYKLKYVDKIRPVQFVDNRKYLVGSVCHNCLHRWIVEANCEPAWMSTIVDQEFEKYIAKNRIVWKSNNYKTTLLEKIRQIIFKIEFGFFVLGLDKRPMLSEWPIEAYDCKLETFLTGRVDLYDQDAEIIYDFKATDDARWYDQKQGLFYAHIINMMRGKLPIRFGQFVPLRSELIVWKDVMKDTISQVMSDIEMVVERIKGGKFNVVESKSYCNECEVKEACVVKCNR